jgi:hypothetical protein
MTPPPLAPGYLPPTGTQPTPPSYAPPTAAPPSTAPPPLAEPRKPTTSLSPNREASPALSEARSYYDVYAVSPRVSEKRAGDRCLVDFWNLTGRELSVLVDGQQHVLSPGKSQPVDVGRRFVWKMDGRDPQAEQVAAGDSAVEIVIRR